MKQILVRKGQIIVEDVPAPEVSSGSILVATHYSCISIGTEAASVSVSGMPLYRRALKQPENVRRVLQMVQSDGLSHTMARVRGKLDAGTPLGYSAAGVVVAVGSEVSGFSIGDRVACAGVGYANHAELLDVPVNLAVHVPDQASLSDAASVALGAIALQGVRRAQPSLGECVVVVGLGLLGQITVQFLKNNGCTVIGIDPDQQRRELAVLAGADQVLTVDDHNIQTVQRLSAGHGADAVVITAAGSANDIVNSAARMCRRKGRVVIVGDVGLGLERSAIFPNEVDILISTSYGPGRYDPYYEEGGQDYPLGYVRWSENRNMSQYVEMLGRNSMRLDFLKPAIFPVDQAPKAYQALKGNEAGNRPLVALLSYDAINKAENPTLTGRTVSLTSSKSAAGKIGFAICGAGSFVQGVHVPNILREKQKAYIPAVMSRSGANAKALAKQVEASYATTDYDEVLKDPNVDVVVIGTRHDLHGSMTLKALEAGKSVLVEKPLTLSPSELDQIEAFYRTRDHAPTLMVGYNRRFAPAIDHLNKLLAKRSSPMMVTYTMNAGYIEGKNWVHGSEGGGRNLGEACHIYDLFCAITGSRSVKISAHGLAGGHAPWRHDDNFSATISFEDGSICHLLYTAMGDRRHPKERMEVFCDGSVYVMDDYKSLSVSGSAEKSWSSKTQDKGHKQELSALIDCLLSGGSWPISLETQLDSARIAFAVEEQLTNSAREISPPKA